MAKEKYNHKDIDPALQTAWQEKELYVSDLTDTSKDPYYLLVEFPYPSGDLHTGHWYAFAVTDIFARFKRMQGKNVLYPFGFDAFGLPAENAAIKRGLDPKKWTYDNMESMREQVRTMGTSFDWSKEVVTCSPEYYKWTQWLFSRLYEHKLAERKEAPVKWCPQDQTVLANEQVIDGRCERCGHEVEEKLLTQWFFSITKYADRLLTDLDALPWREEIKDAQRAWIGKSEGAKIPFTIYFTKNEEDNNWRDADGKPAQLVVFTTRPDTLYGVTYIVLAPEHPWVTAALDGEHDVLTNEDKVRAYVEATKAKTERERMENKEKTGVPLNGIFAIHPLTKEELPVFVADFVLGSYGTGAVMAVPAHDERDYEFAQKYGLPIKQVVAKHYKQTVEPGIYREGEPTIVKDGIITIIKHPTEEKYLGLKWKKVAWGTFLTGGVEEGMTPEETVIKEIHEETGYLHPRIVRKLGVVDGLFYHVPKQTNQHVHGHIFYVELDDNARDAVEPEEEEKHELKWLTIDELSKFLTPDTHHHALKAFIKGYECYGGNGSLIDSDEYTGRDNEEAKWEIAEAAGGERTTNFRIRDWLVSRQRYWGCPIPVVYDPEGKPHLVPTEHLPWTLPDDVDFQAPSGTSPLATSKELKERVLHIFGEGWTPEYDTLDTFVDSSWYFTRYLAPNDINHFSNAQLMERWMPVDRYSGGSEHTTMHLLYARFFYKALYDLALVPTSEPFGERYNRGLILGPDGQKMSKSKGNVINPDEYVQKYGADAVRTYLAFIGPYNEPGSYPWKPEGVEAMRKFIERVYSLWEKVSSSEKSENEMRILARASSKMAVDIERFKLNTGVSSLMIALNSFEEQEEISKDSYLQYLRLLAPFAPHMADHLFQSIAGIESSIHQEAWPTFDESLLLEEKVGIGVQIGGRRRAEVFLSPQATEAEALTEALKDPAVQKALPNGTPSRVVYVPGKILSLIP